MESGKHPKRRMDSIAATASEEHAFVQSLKAGDDGAYQALMAAYGKPVYNLALRLLGDHANAEDVTQETFVNVFRGMKSFGGKSSLRTWIYRIAVNCARQLLRREKRVQPTLPLSEKTPASIRFDPVWVAHQRMKENKLRSAFAALPAPFKEALALCRIEGVPYEEAALVLGIPVGTVKSRVHRGMNLLWQEVYVEDEEST